MALKPLSVLLPSSGLKTVLIVLNRPLETNSLKALWAKAVFKAVADGGSNRLYDALGNERDSYVPNIISGDFDSARKDALSFYKSKGTDIITTQDQDETDFTKCLKVTLDKVKHLEFDYITVLGAFGGRLDQVFANINTLFQAMTLAPKPVLLFSEGSAACLLNKGRHTICVDSGMEVDWCGLVPVGAACDHVTTTGLKWNLDNQRLKFGELVSTSNTYSGAPQVTVETDGPVLWTMGHKI